MKKAIFVCLLLSITMSDYLFAQTAITPVAKNGALHIANGWIVNKNGEAPQLRGISFSWSIWGGKNIIIPMW